MRIYDKFVFIKDNEGEYKYVDCSKYSHRLWKDVSKWTEYDKNQKIVVFCYQGKIFGDTCFFALAFTTKENFENRFSENFDFDKICRVGAEYMTFLEVQEFLIKNFGYKRENIIEETGDVNIKYKLGIISL